jgi:hypothetical protein
MQTVVTGGVELPRLGQGLQGGGMLAVAILGGPQRAEEESVAGFLTAGGFRLAESQGIAAAARPGAANN